MKNISKKTRTKIKIVSATATAIFSLASVFAGTYAWFSSNQSVEANGMAVMVKASGGVSISNVKLIKFNYAKMIGAEDLYDYLQPNRGRVVNYDYVDDSFGTDEIMNAYDPLEKIIKGNSFDLTSMNCNALYEITFTPPKNDLVLSVTGIANGELADRAIGEISMLECADIDFFLEGDFNNKETTYLSGVAYPIGSLVTYNDNLYISTSAIDDDNNTDFEDESWQLIDNFSERNAYESSNAHTDYVIYNHIVYKCKLDTHTGDSSFVPSHWRVEAMQPSSFSPSQDYSSNSCVTANSKCYLINTNIIGGTYSSFAEVLDVTPAIVSEIGDFNSSLSYKIGDLIYQEVDGDMVLCSCKTTIGGSFKPSEWDIYDDYSSSSNYSSNSVVIKNGIAYYCKEDLSAQSFSESNWFPLLFGDIFYPSYDVAMTDPFEVLYYKASYLSSKKEQHKHFYFNDNSWNASHWRQLSDEIPTFLEETSYEINDVVLNSEKYYQCVSPITAQENDGFDKNKWKEIQTFSNSVTYSYNDFVLYNDHIFKCSISSVNVLDSASISIPANDEGDETPLKVYVNINYAPSQLDDYYEKIFSTSIKVYNAIFDFMLEFDANNDNG